MTKKLNRLSTIDHLTNILDPFVNTIPTKISQHHALPCAMVLPCASARRVHFSAPDKAVKKIKSIILYAVNKASMEGPIDRSIRQGSIYLWVSFFFCGFYSAICCFTFSSLPSIACFGLRRFSVTLRSCLEKTGRRVSHVWLMSPNNSTKVAPTIN